MQSVYVLLYALQYSSHVSALLHVSSNTIHGNSWKLNIHCNVYNVHISSQMNPFYIIISC